MLEALQRYDPARGVRFETFAWHRIRGAILDHLRSLDLAVRSDRQSARRIERAHEQLAARLGREPTREELAAEVGLPPEALDAELTRLHSLVVTSFEELVGVLRRGLARLSERERLVLGLYYYEGLTLAEIGGILGLTESRACQIQASALLRLRTWLAQQGFAGR